MSAASRPRDDDEDDDDVDDRDDVDDLVCDADAARVSPANEPDTANMSSPRRNPGALGDGFLGPMIAPYSSRGMTDDCMAVGRAGGGLSKGRDAEKFVDVLLSAVEAATSPRVLAMTVATARDVLVDDDVALDFCNDNHRF